MLVIRSIFMKYLILLLLIFQTIHLLGQKKTLAYQDRVYEENIKTVQLYPKGTSIQANLEPAVIQLNGSKKLRLEFDDLKDDADYYYVYFIHCNANWTPSDLKANMYINAYNEFEIVDFEFSSESRINYVHYTYDFPRFKESGNYLAVVYRNQKKKDIILTKRFYVYENKVGLGARMDRSASVGLRRTHQRLEATVNYKGLRAPDPKEQFTLMIRQNERPDRQLFPSPTYIDDNIQVLRYQNLDSGNELLGGNEFRFFDLSTVNFGGRNVANTQFINNKAYTKLRTDKPSDVGYLINLDLNGKYYIRDLEGRDSRLTSEYVNILFSLDYPQVNDQIYLVGYFNNWVYDEKSLMKYNPSTNRYENQYLLKQGWYDYSYMIPGSETQPIERSFYETENLYEVFLYFRPLGARGDQLIGYYKFSVNKTR